MIDFAMVTIDQHYQDLAMRAADQAEALSSKMQAINEGYDDDGEPETERLCGVLREKDGRTTMVFADTAAPRQRTVIYVNAILDLADMIRREHILEGTHK